MSEQREPGRYWARERLDDKWEIAELTSAGKWRFHAPFVPVEIGQRIHLPSEVSEDVVQRVADSIENAARGAPHSLRHDEFRRYQTLAAISAIAKC